MQCEPGNITKIRCPFRTLSNIYDGVFLRKNGGISAKVSTQLFNRQNPKYSTKNTCFNLQVEEFCRNTVPKETNLSTIKMCLLGEISSELKDF